MYLLHPSLFAEALILFTLGHDMRFSFAQFHDFTAQSFCCAPERANSHFAPILIQYSIFSK